jgi:hypothetical protein
MGYEPPLNDPAFYEEESEEMGEEFDTPRGNGRGE